MAHQQHHADQVEDPHEHTRHVQKLKELSLRQSGYYYMGARIYLEFVDGHPGVKWESLEHGHKELEAS